MTQEDSRLIHVWRSRGFVQPLLLTIGGVVASYVFADAIVGSCEGDVCAYIGLTYVASFLAAMVPGLFGTGLLVALFDDDGFASRAMWVAGAILCLAASILSTVTSSDLASFPDGVVRLLESALIAGVLALVAAIPIGLGFIVARRIKRSG